MVSADGVSERRGGRETGRRKSCDLPLQSRQRLSPHASPPIRPDAETHFPSAGYLGDPLLPISHSDKVLEFNKGNRGSGLAEIALEASAEMHVSNPPPARAPGFGGGQGRFSQHAQGLCQSWTTPRPSQHPRVHTETVTASERRGGTGGTQQGGKPSPVPPSAPSKARGAGQTGSSQACPAGMQASPTQPGGI